jgi:hypothetical protein
MLLREPRERERECSRIKEKGVATIREETRTLPSTTQKSCILPSLRVVVQYICKAKLVFLVARMQTPLDFKNCEIYSSIYFRFVL